MRKLPPLNPLRTFEAAARHENFARAAAELNVTQAAVSRQIMVLENVLSVRLFDREHSSVKLTPAGTRYYEATHQALELIADATEDITHGAGEAALNVQCYTTFALRWLIPRLHRFYAAHPDLQVNLTTSVLPADFSLGTLDASIQFGEPKWPEVTTDLLLPDLFCPVCAPSVAKGLPLERPEDLAGHTFIYSYHRRGDWRVWLSAAGVPNLQPARRVTFESSSLVYQAAIEGLGVAIAQPLLVQTELIEGRLVAPFKLRVRRPLAYYLVRPKKLRVPPKVAAFRKWLLAEAQGSVALEEAADQRAETTEASSA